MSTAARKTELALYVKFLSILYVMKCLHCFGTTDGYFRGPLLLVICYPWLPCALLKMGSGHSRFPTGPSCHTSMWQCCFTLLRWFEHVRKCSSSRPVAATHPIFQSALSAVSFAILASMNCVRLSGGPDQIVMVASIVWQGHSGTTVIEKVGHSCPSADHHLPAH